LRTTARTILKTTLRTILNDDDNNGTSPMLETRHLGSRHLILQNRMLDSVKTAQHTAHAAKK
jgi:hypothetical protein